MSKDVYRARKRESIHGTDFGMFFTVSEDCKSGWVINGAWSFTIEEFNPPHMKYRIDAYPQHLHEVDDMELDDADEA